MSPSVPVIVLLHRRFVLGIRRIEQHPSVGAVKQTDFPPTMNLTSETGLSIRINDEGQYTDPTGIFISLKQNKNSKSLCEGYLNVSVSS